MHVQELEFEDARRHFEESKYLNKRPTELYVKHNTAGKTYEELFETMKFDTFLYVQKMQFPMDLLTRWWKVDEYSSRYSS